MIHYAAMTGCVLKRLYRQPPLGVPTYKDTVHLSSTKGNASGLAPKAGQLLYRITNESVQGLIAGGPVGDLMLNSNCLAVQYSILSRMNLSQPLTSVSE